MKSLVLASMMTVVGSSSSWMQMEYYDEGKIILSSKSCGEKYGRMAIFVKHDGNKIKGCWYNMDSYILVGWDDGGTIRLDPNDLTYLSSRPINTGKQLGDY